MSRTDGGDGVTYYRMWLAAVAATILAGIAVPYGILSGGATGAGIFVFWCLFALAVVVLIATAIGRWSGE